MLARPQYLKQSMYLCSRAKRETQTSTENKTHYSGSLWYDKRIQHPSGCLYSHTIIIVKTCHSNKPPYTRANPKQNIVSTQPNNLVALTLVLLFVSRIENTDTKSIYIYFVVVLKRATQSFTVQYYCAFARKFPVTVGSLGEVKPMLRDLATRYDKLNYGKVKVRILQ